MDVAKFLAMVKALTPNTEQGASIALDDLLEKYPEITIDEVADVLFNMPGSTITDGRLGGIIIPARYFDDDFLKQQQSADE